MQVTLDRYDLFHGHLFLEHPQPHGSSSSMVPANPTTGLQQPEAAAAQLAAQSTASTAYLTWDTDASEGATAAAAAATQPISSTLYSSSGTGVAAGIGGGGAAPRWECMQHHGLPRLGLLFHAMEYPAFCPITFPYELGFCQRGSPLQLTDPGQLDTRNMVWFQVRELAERVIEVPYLHTYT